MEKVFAVIGLGSFGKQICLSLMEKGARVIAIDNNPVLVDLISEKVTRAVLLDATDETGLAGAALQDVDIAIVAMGDNRESSILSTAILKQLSVPFVIARAVSDLHQRVLKQVGADQVINLEVEEGMRLAARLTAPDILDRIPVSANLSLAEIYLPREFNRHKVIDLQLKAKFNLQLVLIKRTGLDVDELGNPRKKEEIIYPQDTTEMKENDILLIVGLNKEIDAFIMAGSGQ